MVTRQSLEPDDRPVQVTGPTARPQTLPLAPESGGRSTGTMPIDESGLYRISDGTRTALAAAGALNPIELADVRATDEKARGPTSAQRRRHLSGSAPAQCPTCAASRPSRSAAGRGWMGFRANGDYVVTGVKETPLLPGLLALMLALGTFILAWRREGR